MKYLLFSLIFACSMNAQTMKSQEGWRMYHMDTPMVGKAQYGGIFVEGDSIKAIKALLKLVDKLQEENEQKRLCIWRGVQFANIVPDYLYNTKECSGFISSARKLKVIKPSKK